MSQFKFTATKLAQLGKQGRLTPDATGYYPVMLGGLNLFNSNNEYYTAEGAVDLFKESGVLQRRISGGNLKIEVGHPKLLPQMTEDQYFNRVMSIEETNVCGHIKEVTLDMEFGRKNPRFGNKDMIGILGLVKPAGPKGPALAEALANTEENVCFSIRALSKNFFHRGQTYRVLQSILTWDWVTEPGLAPANKWDTPVLESIDDRTMTAAILKRIIQETPECMAMESGQSMVREALRIIDEERTRESVRPPAYLKW